MQARNKDLLNDKAVTENSKSFLDFNQDRVILDNVKYGQGTGVQLRMASELHAVKQVGRLPFLTSSNLHEDVLKGTLGPSSASGGNLNDKEKSVSRLSYL